MKNEVEFKVGDLVRIAPYAAMLERIGGASRTAVVVRIGVKHESAHLESILYVCDLDGQLEAIHPLRCQRLAKGSL